MHVDIIFDLKIDQALVIQAWTEYKNRHIRNIGNDCKQEGKGWNWIETECSKFDRDKQIKTSLYLAQLGFLHGRGRSPQGISWI